MDEPSDKEREAIPVAIKDQEEYDRIEAICISLLKKEEDDLSPEELGLLDSLATLLEEYEKRTFPDLDDEDSTE